MAERKALITGVAGQDGSYLAELLLDKGYLVYGLIRRHSNIRLDNLEIISLNPRFELVSGDMTDGPSLRRAISEIQPDEIYNLAAQSFVAASWNQPLLTNDVNYLGFVRLLEAARDLKPDARIYQASSSEMFGNQNAPQSETTPMIPRSPYGVSKLASHRTAEVYRKSFGMYVASGIMFNHESPRRGLDFVTRKIAAGVARRAKNPNSPKIELGYLNAKRDWGYAPDYARAMWLMLQQDSPEDFVIATGENHSVHEFLRLACEIAELPGSCYDHITHEEGLFRPAEVYELLGDPYKAKVQLGWTPSVTFEELVRIMVEAEIQRLQIE